MKWLRRTLVALVLLAILGGIAFRLWRGPSPEQILASIDVPPAPVLSPDEALGAFRVAPGFRVELVAAEPLVVDPVAMDWDDEGRLYVVEMRGFMPDLDGRGEERPVGRVVVLEDVDGDGRMDVRHVFLDGLVLPRAVAVLPEGVLIGEPGHLWLCRDDDGDRRCDRKRRLGGYALGAANPEHLENGLLAGLDGWLYNAKSRRRLRLRDGALEEEATVFRGQWGIAQDDEGRLFHNHNSGLLYADLFPGEYTMRHPATAGATAGAGLSVPLAEGELIWGVRVAPGLNRAYLRGTLRRDGRQAGPTGVSGLAIQRGDQFGPTFRGHAFVPESAGAAVAHLALDVKGLEIEARHVLYPDPDWGQREFLASTDERFRPVDAHFGPDGALWVIDMYRGVIQHAEYVSDHLRDHVESQGLEAPGEHGRIWRVVREDRPIERRPVSLDGLDRQLAALDHPNGWVRDRAQRRLVAEAAPAALARLRALDFATPVGRVHALWALAGLGALDAPTWRRALADPSPSVRRAALRAGEPLLAAGSLRATERSGRVAEVLQLRQDADPGVRLQALHTLGAAPAAVRPLSELLTALRGDDPIERQAALSGLGRLEEAALDRVLGELGDAAPDASQAALLARIVGALHRAAQGDGHAAAAAAALLDRIESLPDVDQRVAALEGIARAQDAPDARRVELASRHPLFDEAQERPEALADALASVRVHFTWPGDPRPGGARALTAEEAARRERGASLYAATCATCHGESGTGRVGLAPPLVGSRWVRNADAWLVRIVLHGLTGPLRIDGVDWNGAMPGHAHDPRFDDETLAGLLTHLRRSWGHADDPVAPETVAAIRAAESDRRAPWTVAELDALDVDHRLDRYVGLYEIPIVGLTIRVKRVRDVLAVGQAEGGAQELEEIGNGRFVAPEMRLRFIEDAAGAVEGLRFDYGGASVRAARKE